MVPLYMIYELYRMISTGDINTDLSQLGTIPNSHSTIWLPRTSITEVDVRVHVVNFLVSLKEKVKVNVDLYSVLS